MKIDLGELNDINATVKKTLYTEGESKVVDIYVNLTFLHLSSYLTLNRYQAEKLSNDLNKLLVVKKYKKPKKIKR
jgi:hypothetical protein